jgi:CBS domain containing-hemolysin-like protein
MAEGTHTIYWVLFVLAIVLSAFFSASEAAFLSIQRVKLRQMTAAGVPGAQRVAQLAEHPERFLPTVLVGNNLVNTAAAVLGTIIAVDVLRNEGLGALVAAIVVSLVLIIFGESIPKTVGSYLRERLALVVVSPLMWLERLLFPLVAPLQRITHWVISRAGGGAVRDQVTQEEIKVLISLGREAGAVEENEAQMLLRMMHVTGRRVSEVMTPRTNIVTVEKGITVARFLEVNARQYFSRFPVFDGTPDNVVGVLSAKGVIRALGRGELKLEDLAAKVMRDPHFVPESRSLLDAVLDMRRAGTSIALAVDEFGGVVGLVTFKQLVGEIVGLVEVGEAEEYRVVNENSFEVAGSTRIDYLNEHLKLDLPKGEYETVAGFLMSTLGHVPQKGERVNYRGLQLEVLAALGPRVQKVAIVRRVAANQSKATPSKDTEVSAR